MIIPSSSLSVRSRILNSESQNVKKPVDLFATALAQHKPVCFTMRYQYYKYLRFKILFFFLEKNSRRSVISISTIEYGKQLSTKHQTFSFDE